MSLVSAIQVPQGIANAIKKASKATGADFSYLLKTAERESSFNKGAKAKTSSAAGLFQFIESTWLKTVKDVGNKFGLNKYTPHIFKTRSGRHYVPNQKLRQEILQLRHNPEVSATIAGAFTQKNSEFISSKIGREPSQGELYIAHFLGPKGASDLISRVDKNPNSRADRLFPRAARANKSIFYSRGRPRSVSQVYKNLVRDHAKLQTNATVQTAEPAAPVWKTTVAPAEKAIQTARLDKAPASSPPVQDHPAKLVSEPVSFFSYPPQPVKTAEHPLAQKVSLYPPLPVPLDGFDGVEAVIIPNPAYAAKSARSKGLAGQLNSPIAKPVKIAALTHTGLKINPGSMSDASLGSLGLWTTIVNPPADQQGVSADQNSDGIKSAALVKEAEILPQKRRRAARAPGLIEQSKKRNSVPPQPPIQAASLNKRFIDDFWMQVSLDSN